MKEFFKDCKFHGKSLALIDACNSVIASYQAQGYRLTLRQTFYQLVTQNIIPNTPKSYDNLGKVVSNARLAGLMDWEAIEDRVRVPRSQTEFRDPKALMDTAIAIYRLPRWANQPHYVELWVEKDALAGVLEPLTQKHHITLMVNRGYSSQSAMYEASKRFIEAADDGKDCELLYLGDHDPSGEDMVRDVSDRLTMFGASVSVQKIGLTTAQVKQYRPPPNPAKLTDSRAAAYIALHGNSSWEVDALPPRVLSQLVDQAVEQFIDQDALDDVLELEKKDMELMNKAVNGIMKKRDVS